MSALKVATRFTAIDKFSSPVKNMGANVSSFAAKAEVAVARSERAFRRLTSPIRSVTSALGSMGLFLGGAALLGVVGSVIKIFKEFEQANANLASVLGKSQSETIALATDAKRLGAVTAFTASQVAGLQTEFAKLGFSQDEILNATAATLSLAAATRTELPQAAVQVGAAIRAFGLDASEAARVSDVFAASTSKSALDMEKLDTAMGTVAPVAKQFGFSLEDTVALLGKLSDAGFDASTAATSTRNIMLNMADKSGKLAKALGRPVKTLDDMVGGMKKLKAKGTDLAKMLDLTDKRSVAAFATFIDNADSVSMLSKELQKSEGFAKKMADTQLNTLGGSITILQSAWEGWILSMEDGTGAFSQTLKNIIQVATEMLSMATGTAAAESALDSQGKKLRFWANIGITAIKIIAILVASMLAFKIILIASKIALVAYNIAFGVYNALFTKSLVLTNAGTLAQKAFIVTSKLGTAAFWLYDAALVAVNIVTAIATGNFAALNAIMAANPIGIIIVAIAALVALMVLVIAKWNTWGAALSFVLGPIGMIISLIQSFRRNWDGIVQAFKTGGIVEGLKMIGATILDAVLMPLQQLLTLIGKIPGLSFAAEAAEGLDKFRAKLGVNVESDESGKVLDSKADIVSPIINPQKTFMEKMITERQNVSIDIADKTGRAKVQSDNNLIPIKLTSTSTF